MTKLFRLRWGGVWVEGWDGLLFMLQILKTRIILDILK